MSRFESSDKYEEFIATVNDRTFWSNCLKLKNLLKMPSQLIGEMESDSSDLSQVYSVFQKLLSNPLYTDQVLQKKHA